ncbi:MAG: glycosyltransferase family 4 protein [Deltaproteobacteria bacterium]|nr:glycosyltransferase family 4 protein [Deltaproteobacteria bacterium]
MNILIVTPYFPPQTGGVATFLDSLQRFLRQQGHSVYVLLPGSSHDITPRASTTDAIEHEFYMRVPFVPGVILKGILAFFLFCPVTILRLSRFLEENAIDLVLLEYPLPYMFYFTVLQKLRNVKIIVGIHGDDVLSLHLAPKHEQWVVKHLIRDANWVLAHSASLLSQIRDRVPQLNGNHSYIPYGIEAEPLRVLAQYPKNAFSLTSHPYVLTVAKLYERKGLDVLLQAIQKLGAMVQAHRFVIVGDGPEEHSLKQLASRLGIEELVIFTGELQKPEIAQLLQNCEFFVLPSRSEPFGITLLEAMTFGKAIIATKVGGIPEFVIDGHNGVLIPPDDSTALAEQIRRVMNDRELRARIGKNGLMVVEEKYDYTVLIRRYEELFSRILDS